MAPPPSGANRIRLGSIPELLLAGFHKAQQRPDGADPSADPLAIAWYPRRWAMAYNSLEMDDTVDLDLEEMEIDDGNAEEAAEEIDLLVRCVHAARYNGV
jgi:hypothetical protein